MFWGESNSHLMSKHGFSAWLNIIKFTIQ